MTTDVAGAEHTRRSHIRGSSLMTLGRLISILINLVVQVLTVQYLVKADFGLFAYAMAVVQMGAVLSSLGQSEALGHHFPSMMQRGEDARARGAAQVAFALVGLAGSLYVLGAIAFQLGGWSPGTDSRGSKIVLILILLSLVRALDTLSVSALAALGKPMAIFFRRFILTPLLRLASVVFVVLVGGSVELLAWAYLISGVVGLFTYAYLVQRAMAAGTSSTGPAVQRPVGEMVRFGAPLIASDVLQVLRVTFVVIVLERLRTVEDVAAFRAVVPVAQLNLVVMQSFKLLYLPVASRLWAADRHDEAVELYWHSAAWLSVGTFPIFITTLVLAEPLTTLLFGADYASSGVVLAILAVGYYVNAGLGLNSQTLKAMGNVRAVAISDGITAAMAVVLNILFIDRWGLNGAAVSVAALLVFQNGLLHASLVRTSRTLAMPKESRLVYLTIIGISGSSIGLQRGFDLALIPSIGLATLGSLVVLGIGRRSLDIGATFPEVLKIPLVGRWLG